MDDVSSDIGKLLDHVLATARRMLEEHGDFDPFGASVSWSGELRTYGGPRGVEHEDRTRIYRLMRAGFAKDAAEGRVRAVAVVAIAAIPPELHLRYTQGVAVAIEGPGDSRRVYLPYHRARAGLFGVLGRGGAKVNFADPVAVEAPPFVFAGVKADVARDPDGVPGTGSDAWDEL